MKRYLSIICVCALLTGCEADVSSAKQEQGGSAADNSSVLDSESSMSDVQEKEADTEEIPDSTIENERPVIIQKYKMLFFAEKMGGIRDFSENVLSVYDPEDGELPYCYIGGFDMPESELDDFWYDMTHNDKPESAESYGSGFYFSLGNNTFNDLDGTRTIMTFAYDKEGQLTTSEYRIKYIPNSDEAIETITVSDGLNVYSQPSASEQIIGNVWPNAKYQVFEETVDSDLVWYRIGDDLWIVDEGGSIASVE